MVRLLTPLGIDSRLLVLLAGVGMVSLSAVWPVAAVAKDGRGEVRVPGVCSRGADSKLRLKSSSDDIEVSFEVEHSRPGTSWRVVLVHERRVAWRGVARTSRPGGAFEVRQKLRDLPGADTVTARASDPGGLVCRATATLPDSETLDGG